MYTDAHSTLEVSHAALTDVLTLTRFHWYALLPWMCSSSESTILATLNACVGKANNCKLSLLHDIHISIALEAALLRATYYKVSISVCLPSLQ